MDRVIILAGGRGSRMGDGTDIIPKPMIKVGDKPIIDHIVESFTRRLGVCDFIVASGYKSEILEQHFQNLPQVQVVNTGIETQTAGRLKRLNDEISFQSPFYVCYGDGLTDFNYLELQTKSCPTSIVNMLVVHPIGRFGEVNFNKKTYQVQGFQEKPVQDRWINGGYFYMSPDIFSYITGDTDVLEVDIFSKVVADNKMFCIPYEGYWHCMDTPKDKNDLEKEYLADNALWLK